jgi:hypothetical protein
MYLVSYSLLFLFPCFGGAFKTPPQKRNAGDRTVARVACKLFPLLRRKINPPAARVSFSLEMSEKYLDRSAARERAELYYLAHPGSPSAARRPRLFARSGVWVALLGPTVREGIAGFGPTVETALRAFDVQYISALRPPSDAPPLDRAA